MRPNRVTVGPLTAASANAICLSQTPTAGALTLNGALDCVEVRSDGDEMTSGVAPAIRERVAKVVEITDSRLSASSRLDLRRLR